MYEAFIKKTVPKVLSQIDRDKHSKTYGCCDRNYWHLKTRDFSSAILQQSGLSLAVLYLENFEGNIFYKNEYVKEWAIATVYYWQKIQLKDGSFNEYYPNEHGFPPTAFSLYAVCEVYKRLHLQNESLLKSFRKTCRYLINHIESKAYNQEIASITALYSAYSILNEEWILIGLKHKLQRILDFQSEDGWFSEYEGADIGYLSVSLDMLSEYYWMSKDETVLEPLNKIVEFIKYFIHPDGSIGGEYASRNTTYFLPNGLEVLLQSGNSDAGAIKRKILENSDKVYYFMDSVDDRYCSHYLLHSFLRALEKEKNNPINCSSLLPCENNSTNKYFKEAGLFIYGDKNVYSIIGGKKGGVLKLYKEDNLQIIDCGYRVNYGKGKVAVTNWQDDTWNVDVHDNIIRIKGMMSLVSLKVPSPILHMGLRVVSFFAGNKIIGFLKKKMILVNIHTDIAFSREITFGNEDVRIVDEIISPKEIDLEAADNFSMRHVASGKFYSNSDIALHNRKSYPNVKRIKITQQYNYELQKLTENYVLQRD